LHIPNIPVVKIALAIISICFIKKFGGKWNLFKKVKNIKEILILTLLLLFLFAINNYFIINYDETTTWKIKYKEISINIILLRYIISSTSEEIIYRGFVQNYINDKIGGWKTDGVGQGYG
jgi:membrane protease YdiL (CAAX protease family)